MSKLRFNFKLKLLFLVTDVESYIFIKGKSDQWMKLLKMYSGEVYLYWSYSVNVKYIWKYENTSQKLMICNKIIFLVFVKILTIYWHDRQYIHAPITDIGSKHNEDFKSYTDLRNWLESKTLWQFYSIKNK